MPIKIKPDMPYSKMVDKTFISPEEEEEVYTKKMQDKIQKLMDFFGKIENPYGEFDPNFLNGTGRPDIFVDKKAYPNTDYHMYVPGAHNTDKWLQTVKEVYYKEKNGSNRVMAIRQATNGWNTMETYDFLNWLRYYEGNTHLKYKVAQLWYENGAPGYFLHVKQDPKKEDSSSVQGKDIDMARDAIADELPVSEKKRIIEKQRNKIIGRLDSAEKLLRTHEGQIFAGREFESLLETIYQLKKKVQMVNKISTSTKIYEDMIIREANIMNKKGFIKSANLLFSLSQANNPPANLGDVNKPMKVPEGTPPAPPQQGSGSAGGLPSVGPGMPQNPPESAPNENITPKGISKFLNNLDGIKDEHDSEDVLEVIDTLDINDAENEMFVTEAQELPPPTLPSPDKSIKTPVAPKPQIPIATKQIKKTDNEPLEVKENISEINNDNVSPQARDFDNMIDSAFANIKVSDVIAKLEDLAKIFKTREIPRQLSIVDMMLDSLGLAAYFPSLSEATNKALESNNYISTRVDDILAKLHGSIETKEVDLRGDSNPRASSPEIDSLKNNLQDQENKEKSRKKLRKEQADQELDLATQQPKETPEIDIEEDLSKPEPAPEAPIPAAPKPPAKPAPIR